MENVLWNLCCGICVGESSLLNRCCVLFVVLLVEYVLSNLCCGVFLVESSLLRSCCGV